MGHWNPNSNPMEHHLGDRYDLGNSISLRDCNGFGDCHTYPMGQLYNFGVFLSVSIPDGVSFRNSLEHLVCLSDDFCDTEPEPHRNSKFNSYPKRDTESEPIRESHGHHCSGHRVDLFHCQPFRYEHH